MTYPDNIYYDTLTVEQNDYLFSLREDYRNNGGFTGEEQAYLDSLSTFIQDVNALHQLINFGLAAGGDSTWIRKW